MLKKLRHAVRLRRLRWKTRANNRRIYSRLLDSMPSDESDKFIKDWEAKEGALDREFLRLMTDRLHEQAEWWWTYIPDRNERPDYWTKPEKEWRWLLNKHGITMALRIIRDERREHIKWNADVIGVLSPLFVGLIGALVGLVGIMIGLFTVN